MVPDRRHQYPPAAAQRVRIWTDWPLDRYRRETGDEISQEDFEARIVETPNLPRNGAISARSTASNGSTGRSMSLWARGFSPRGQGHQPGRAGRKPEEQSRLAPPHHRRLERRRARPDGAAAVPQDLSVPCRRRRVELHLVPADLRSGAGLCVQAFSAALLTRMLAAAVAISRASWSGRAVMCTSISTTPNWSRNSWRGRRRAHRSLKLLRTPDSIFDFAIEDFEVLDYAPQAHISAPVAV